ncbi:MAG: NADH-quinone oxidoreductase subunit H, partial [Fibrobacteraceae bacterium]
ALIQILVLLVKACFFCFVWIWVRWTLPRFRYDHVMNLGWKVILNIALVNLVITAVVAKLVLGGN